MSFPTWITQSAGDARASRVVKSAVITISSGAARFAGSFVTAIVLGRLLSPNDFGLVGMVMPIMAFVGMLADGGVSNHTLQSKELNQQQLSLTFWIGAVISLALFVVLIICSPLVASLYGDDRLQLIVVVVSTSLLFSIFDTQHNALVKRCFMHNYYAYAEIAGSLAGMASGIALALWGAGYWSIVSVPIARHIAHSATIWYLTGWVPTLPTIDSEKIKEILSFGGYVILSNAIVTGCRNLDKVILGLKYNAEEVGFYAMAYNIMMLPFLQILTPAGGAIVPYFSQIRENREQFAAAIAKVTSYLGCIVAPIMAFAAINSEEILVFILGEQWRPSAPIFALLSYASISISLIIPLNWAMVASGQPSKLAQWSVITIIPIIAAYLIGAPWGGSGVAAGYLVFTCINLLALPFYCSKLLKLSALHFLKTAVKIFFIGLFVSLSQHYLSLYMDRAFDLHVLLSLSVKFLVMLLILCVLLPIFARGIVADGVKFLNKRRLAKQSRKM